MNKLKIISLLLAIATFSMFGFGCKSNKPIESISIVDENATPIESTVTEIITTETVPVETFTEVPVSFPDIEPVEIGNKYQAEDCSYSPLLLEDKIVGFEEEGYVTGFSNKSLSLNFNVSTPTNQHYDLTFCIASNNESTCNIIINDRNLGNFTTTSDGKFTRITIYGVFLTKGNSNISISSLDTEIAVDYLELSNNTSLSEVSYNHEGELSNENAGEAAVKLMNFMSENYGKYVITGQYASDETNKEINLIYTNTGKKPVIRFDALEATYSSYDESFKNIEASAQWARDGGVVGLMWHWNSPSEKSSVYANETDFELANAVTDIDIALLSQEEIRGLYGEGKISEECYGIILDIDNVSGQLISLKNKGIPVLWRPLHEASGDWFWWGASGADDYRWLWSLMYTRMTEYFELDNLIWIWNAQSKDYIIPSVMFDIASVDVYIDEEKEYGSRYEQFVALQQFLGEDKLIALSECSSIPDIDATFRDNSVWSFFGLWYGDYIMTVDGKLSEKYMSKDSLIKYYNSEGALSLDEYINMTSH